MKNILIIFIFLFSCKSQDKVVETKLKKCVNKLINQDFESFYKKKSNIDFYFITYNIEQILLNDNFLDNPIKESYIKLITKLLQDEKTSKFESLYIKLTNEFDKIIIGFEDSTYYPIYLYEKCPKEIIITERNKINSTLYRQFETGSYLLSYGHRDEKLIKKFIKETKESDFEKISYRAPIIILVYLNLKIIYG